MQVRIIKVGNLQTNCYILVKDGNCLVVDPGDQFYSIDTQIGTNKLLGILITHRHSDHIGALDELENTYRVPVYDFNSTEEKKYEIGPFKFEVIRNPGHSSDSISFFFYEYNFMFAGDFIFKNSIGRTDLPTGSNEDMKNSLVKIYDYSDRIRIYPGHGDTTVLGIEKENNPFFRNIN